MIKNGKLNFHELIGFLIPLPVFFDPASSIFFANSALAEGGGAFPLSILFLPLSLVYFFLKTDWKLRKSISYVMFLCTVFCTWVLVLGLSSISYSIKSLLFSIQWIIPFLWMPYFFTIFSRRKILAKNSFFKGFSEGVVFTILYIFFSGALEIIIYGGLLDFGRMTQNKIFVGQYQLYVYTPTILAFGIIVYNWLWRAQYIRQKLSWILLINIMAFISLIFLGAREAILIYIVGMISFYALVSIRRSLKILISTSALVILVMINYSWIINIPGFSEVRAINKFTSLRDEGQGLGARDVMVKEYLQVIDKDLVFGARMLPPSVLYPELSVEAPSAHNYYIDVWAWSGILGAFSLYTLVLYLLSKSFYVVLISYSRATCLNMKNNDRVLKVGVALCLILYFCVSNNINVPMRQPITGALVSMLIAYLLMQDIPNEHTK